MVDLIRWLKRFYPTGSEHSVAKDEVVGFVYVGNGVDGPMTSAAPGLQIGTFIDTPPWIVVDHEPQSIILAKWPGRLWKVRILQKASNQPRAYAGYTRATAVDVVQEVPLATLFPCNGEAVVGFLNSVAQLTVEVVTALGESQDDEAARIHNLVWSRWLSIVDPQSPFLHQNHAGVISMGAKAPGSPVGNAPSVLHSELTKRAQEIAGERAFFVDHEERYFSPEWSRAADCLQHSLFAVGVAEHLLSASERTALRRAYERIMFDSNAPLT